MSEFEGTLVRFGDTGVGVVDVDQLDQYVYFTPIHIVGYKGQTIRELTSGARGRWTEGKTVVVQGDVVPGGSVKVDSVALKR